MRRPDAGAWRTAFGALRPRRAAARSAALHRQSGGLEALHVAGLWAVAVAQPLFDLLRRSPEFFVAHDTRPGDLLGLVAVLGLAGPACCLAAIRLGRRLGPRPHALAAAAAVGVLAAAVALAAVRQAAGWGAEASFGTAAACGALAGAGYVLSPAVRLFATFLSPAALVAPAVFLTQPAIAPLLSAPRDGAGAVRGVVFDDPPPVVVAVFDQLPLVSLLDGEGGIDRRLYPGFAALADESSWFRNASAVGGWTEIALPAVVTGNYPVPGRLPTADGHPANLFTLLGSHYRLHVREPLTGLCPETLCASDRPGTGAWLAGVLSDLTVVYLQAVLPDDVAARLPPVTGSWRDFAADDTLPGRWLRHRERDRGAAAGDFIAAIAPDPRDARPPLHFLHALLPHEPWVHLPTGQRHTLRRSLVGAVRDRWRDDAWAVTLDYQRHLLQVQHADTLLGALIERLRAAGIWDDALVVVTADHGASLRPGFEFRTPVAETFADVAAVPLFVKRPGQRRGDVSTANVETIDVLPTLAAEIGVRLPWETDGRSVFSADRAPRPGKTMFLDGGRRRLRGPPDLEGAIAEGVAHKLARFEAGDPTKPRLGRYDDLVGAPVAGLRSEEPAGFDVAVDGLARLRDVDPDAYFVPATLGGGIVPGSAGAALPTLAVAVNGVVAAVTRPYSFPAFGHAAPWEAFVDPDRLAPGVNHVAVFAVGDGPDGAPVLREAPLIGSPQRPINLVPETAAALHGVTAAGFLPTESTAQGDLRWTTGEARLSAPINPRFPPSALAVRILTTGPQKQLRIAANGCTLFDGLVFGRWAETLALDGCRLDSSTIEIELLSNVHQAPATRRRWLGVAVGAVELHGGGPAR